MSLGKAALYLALHFLIAFLAVGALVAFGWHALRPILLAIFPIEFFRREAPLILPLFPLQSVSAFTMGLSLGRRRSEFARATAANWIWVAPLLWLGVVMLIHHFHMPEDLRLQFGIRLIAVLPFLTSASYSLGHALGTRGQRAAASSA
jgi:hypothetical protein